MITSTTMSDNHRKEALSFAYISALSAAAGFTCERGPNPDIWKVDAALMFGDYRIDVQLKATSSPRRLADGLRFQLDRATYDVLRNVSRPTPIILAVLELPENPALWLECTPENLILRRCLWWDWIAGYPGITGESRVVIIPETQQLDLAALENLMEQTRQGLPLKEQ